MIDPLRNNNIFWTDIDLFDIGKRNNCFNEILGNNAGEGIVLNFKRKPNLPFELLMVSRLHSIWSV